MKKRMALLSTWQEKCGIAHYSSFLKRALDPYLDVVVIPLPRATMRDESDRPKADAYIDQIVTRLDQFDVINIQLEFGIFGNRPAEIARRFNKLAAASRELIVTFHSLRGPDLPRWQQLAGALRRASAGRVYQYLHDFRAALLWRCMYRALSNHARSHKVTVIAHTKRDAKRLGRLIAGAQVLDHPLTYMSEADIAGVETLAQSSSLPALLPAVSDDVRFIGVFGFFAPHKGFETAISALKYLPRHYHLLVVSGMHEGALRVGDGTNAYLLSLIKLVEKLGLFERVHFIGSVSDDDLLLSMKLCDAAIMPYANTDQSASGPASQAIELDRPSYLTRSLQFIELERYLPDAFQFFDIGNYIELAQKIMKGPKGEDRMIGEMRIVEFPRIHRPITMNDARDNYLRAVGLPRVESSSSQTPAAAASPALAR